MVETDFAFGFFKDGFNRPAHPTQADELTQWRIGGRIAEVIFDHGPVVQIAADDQPEFGAGKLPRDSVTRTKAKSQTIGP